MILWAVLAALALAVAIAIAAPLVRGRARDMGRSQQDLVVYRDQLLQLQRDTDLGLLPADQAATARLEIERRILQSGGGVSAGGVGAGSGGATDAAAAGKGRFILAVLLVVGVPLATVAVYFHLGAPELPGQPFASREADPSQQMALMAEKLEAELKDKPDVDGYVNLAELYTGIRRFARAADAYRQAIALNGNDGQLWAACGEAVALANDGMVVPEARQNFLQALRLDPREPRARFYLGLAEAQIGRSAEAVAIWRDLERGSPDGAPWLSMLRNNIEQQAKVGGFDPASIPPAPPALPPAGTDPKQAASPTDPMSANADTIQAMVESLAAKLHDNPNDEEGWLRLARSYRVLGKFDQAIDAANHAVALSPKGVEPKLALAQIQLGRSSDDHLPADFIGTMREVLALDSVNPMALYYLGRAEAEANHPALARAHWEKLLTLLPADSAGIAEVRKQLATLPSVPGGPTQAGPAKE